MYFDKGCTTKDTYIILFRENEMNVNDGTCDWNGGIYLKKQLFGVN